MDTQADAAAPAFYDPYDDLADNDDFPFDANVSELEVWAGCGGSDVSSQPLLDEILRAGPTGANVAVLAVTLLLGCLANLAALPVILFRRTRFGNGLFAVLILCLVSADVLVLALSVAVQLVMEIGELLWGGAPGSCQVECKNAGKDFLACRRAFSLTVFSSSQVYYWLSAWATGLSAYLLVAIVGMVMVKTTTSCLQRLRDCRWLLLALLVMSGLYAAPELLVRDSVPVCPTEGEGSSSGPHICILGVTGLEYALYVAFR